ncbi:MAG: GDSL-type esterase/lipase family protein [Saprospiraceae bacterium]
MKIKLFVILLSAFILQACPPIKKNLVYKIDENHRFEKEIQAFEEQDKENGIDKREILFVGSSSIRMWTTLSEDMQPYKVLNRGFGGATTAEVLQYYDRIIKPYKPKTVVIYVGENDISEGGQPQETVFLTNQLFNKIHKDFKKTKIIYISMKPSISRWNLWEDYKKGNATIKKICESNDRLFYLESADVMLNDDGSIKKDIFIEDGLHMNAKGYEDWTKIVRSLLDKIS